MRAIQRAVLVLVPLFGLGSTAAFSMSPSGFQCDAYVGSIVDDPSIVRVFVTDNTNEAVELAGGRYLAVFEGYGEGVRMSVSSKADLLPLAISAISGTSGSIFARDGAIEVNASCIRQGK